LTAVQGQITSCVDDSPKRSLTFSKLLCEQLTIFEVRKAFAGTIGSIAVLASSSSIKKLTDHMLKSYQTMEEKSEAI
jgi:hypothetical protein